MALFSRKRRNELHCHACDKYVQFIVDQSLDGNHVLNCPNCGHEHCRVVKNGLITGERWDSRNGPTYYIASSATSFTNISACTVTSSAYFTMMTDTYSYTSGSTGSTS